MQYINTIMILSNEVRHSWKWYNSRKIYLEAKGCAPRSPKPFYLHLIIILKLLQNVAKYNTCKTI